jgi:hypothetical protein
MCLLMQDVSASNCVFWHAQIDASPGEFPLPLYFGTYGDIIQDATASIEQRISAIREVVVHSVYRHFGLDGGGWAGPRLSDVLANLVLNFQRKNMDADRCRQHILDWGARMLVRSA